MIVIDCLCPFFGSKSWFQTLQVESLKSLRDPDLKCHDKCDASMFWQYLDLGFIWIYFVF